MNGTELATSNPATRAGAEACSVFLIVRQLA